MLAPFIDTSFENASPLRHEQLADGSLRIEPLHDYERFTGNCQMQHWNFKLHIPPQLIGKRLTIIMPGADNVWNGRRIQALEGGRLNIAVSYDLQTWAILPARPLDEKCYSFSYELELKSPLIQIARNVPYTLTDLNRRLDQISSHPAVRICPIGSTVEGRPLEIVELGNPDSARQVLIRAACHPWEPGGTWFLDGVMAFLTGGNPSAESVLKNTCFCLMPMANKDGVYRGRSRFNINGIDLNRNWLKDYPADPKLAPENACLQNWLSERKRQRRLPALAIDIHNDCDGKMHLGPHDADPIGYGQRMKRLEMLMKEMTWFREGAKEESFRGSFACGMMEIYGIDSFVYELHSEWAQGLNRAPLHSDWQQLGASYAEVMNQYL
jgi:hypothetical protein